MDRLGRCQPFCTAFYRRLMCKLMDRTDMDALLRDVHCFVPDEKLGQCCCVSTFRTGVDSWT